MVAVKILIVVMVKNALLLVNLHAQCAWMVSICNHSCPCLHFELSSLHYLRVYIDAVIMVQTSPI